MIVQLKTMRALALTIGTAMIALLLPFLAQPAGAAPARSTTTKAATKPADPAAEDCIDTGAKKSRGAAAVARLGDDLDEAAAQAGQSPARLRKQLLVDDTLWIDGCGRPYYVEPTLAEVDADHDEVTDLTEPTPEAIVVPYADTFKLHSRPDALKTIYLDFDGMAITGSSWAASYNNGVAWNAPAFDTDGNSATFSNAERDIIQNVWQRMSEDYALFDVDVTTEDPGFDAIDRSSSADQRFGTAALFTNDTVIGGTCGCGGIAYIGVFDNNQAANYQPAFVFKAGLGSSAKNLAEAATHEVGHNLGLNHDGKTTGCGTGGAQACGYYTGHGAWAPIMGVGYSKPITQWSKGEYTGATNTEDDFTVMASNGAVAVTDDHGNTTGAATALGATLPVGATGEISTTTDVDMFSFTSAGGATTFTVTPTGVTPNLDASITLYNSAGTVVGTADPTSAMSSSDVATGLSATYTSGVLAAGTYYVGIDGVGALLPASTGYSDYASLGRYAVSISATGGPAVATSSLPDSATSITYGTSLVATGGSTPYTWSVTGGSLPAGLTLASDGTLSGTSTGSSNATFTVQVSDGAARTATRSLTINAGVTITSKNLPEASTSTAYSTALTASGGSGSYTWTVSSGSLPSGLSLASNGTISGTPTTAGTASFTVQANDGAGRTRSRVTTITVAAGLTLNPISSTTTVIGTAISLGMPASGGRPSYIWALESGSLPTGVRLNDNGSLTGTPTSGGTFNSVVRVTDRSGRTKTNTFTMTVGGFTFAPSSLPTAGQSAAYSQQLSITYANSTAPFTWAVASGSLPAGVTLSSSGLLSGTPTASGTSSVTVRATDAAGWTDTKAYSLLVATAPGAPTIGSATAGNGQATVSWTAPASNGGSAVTGYVVTPYIGASAQPAQTFNTNATTQTVTGLTNGTAYSFKVAATNVAGAGTQSAATSSVTPVGPPDAPSGVSATRGNAQATVSWTAPASNGGSAVTGYVVTPYIGATAQPAQTFNTNATTQTLTGLTNGTAYTFKVAAKNSSGTGTQSSASSAVTPATTPGAPTGASASAGNTQATVSWTAPAATGGSAITGYVVTPYIGATAQPAQTFDSTATSQTVTGLTNGTTYTFKVAATNDVGTGSPSGATSSVTPQADVPGTPTSVAGTPGASSATLSWTAPSSDGGSAITGYVVTPYIGATAQPAQTFNSTATTQTVTGLTNGTTYTFTVAARNAIGTGSQSMASGSMTPSGTPGAPTNATATGLEGKVLLSWTAPASDGGSAITGYVVTPSIGATAQTPIVFDDPALAQDITGLANGTAYTFTVAAKNANGTGSESSASNSATPAGKPDAPTGVTATAGNQRATVSWTAPAFDGGRPITGYVVTPSVDGTPASPELVAAGTTTLTVTGLTNGTSVTFVVAAANTIGTGTASAASSPVIPSPVVPGAPTGVTATAGDGAAAVTWTAPDDDGGSAITGYVVIASAAGVPQAAIPFDSTATSQIMIGLTNGTAYTFTVAARNAVGDGVLSTPSEAVTPAGAPGAPTSISGTPGAGQVALTWTAPTSDGGSSITGYVITPSIGATAQTPLLVDATTSHTVTGLANGTAYTFTVSAVNSVGQGPGSSASAPVTPMTVPDAPTAAGAVRGDGQATVSWTAPASDGGSAITGYVVTPSIGIVEQTAIPFDSTATSQVITGLTNGTSYTFQVSAVNAVGTGARSGASAAVTPAGAPGAPTIGSATGGNAKATVTWTAPASDGGAGITGYVVTPSIGAAAQAPQTFNSTATSQTVTGLTNGTAYTFTVAAKNAVGTGTPSAASNSTTPTAVTAPSAPSIRSAVPGNSTATVAWNAPSSNGGASVSGYVVTPYVGTTAQTPQTFNSTATSQTVAGLVNGTAYTFTVAAKNAAGTGTPSPESGVVNVGAPGVPGFQSAAPGDGSAKVGWTASNGNGSVVTGYVITPFVGSVPQAPQTFASTATTQFVTGLTNGVEYTFAVAGINAHGIGASATTAAVRVGTPNGPGFPRGVPGTTTARIAWVASLANGAPIQGYRVTPYVGSTALATVTFNSTATAQVLTGLTSGTSYSFKVEAFNSIGTGTVSQSAVWLQGSPEPPGYASATPTNGGGIVQYYVPPANSAPITSYTVWPVQGSTVLAPQVFATPAATQLAVTGLTNGVTYSLRVAATNSVGTGPYNTTNTFVAGSPTGVGFPSAQPGVGTAKVAWSAANPNGSPVTSHVVTPYIGSVAQPSQTFANVTTATVTGLTNGTTYTFKVKAINAIGTGLEIATALSTKVGTPTTPVFPSGAPLDKSAKVSWAAPTANASAITGYVVTPMVGTTAQAPRTFTSTATTQTITGLTNGTTYTFRVSAINAIGTGPYAVTSTVKVGLPSAPTAITATAGAGQATVNWAAPSGNGSTITGYTVTPYIGTIAQPPRTFTGNPATTQVITGLTTATTYTFKVQAINTIGTSTASTASNAVTPT